MLAPNAEQIEGAAEWLKDLSPFIQKSQMTELTSAMGAATIKKLGAAFPPTDEFRRGYELGLQTARVAIRQSAAIMLKGVKPDDVL